MCTPRTIIFIPAEICALSKPTDIGYVTSVIIYSFFCIFMLMKKSIHLSGFLFFQLQSFYFIILLALLLFLLSAMLMRIAIKITLPTLFDGKYFELGSQYGFEIFDSDEVTHSSSFSCCVVVQFFSRLNTLLI